jgi:hypothetical protein
MFNRIAHVVKKMMGQRYGFLNDWRNNRRPKTLKPEQGNFLKKLQFNRRMDAAGLIAIVFG